MIGCILPFEVMFPWNMSTLVSRDKSAGGERADKLAIKAISCRGFYPTFRRAQQSTCTAIAEIKISKARNLIVSSSHASC